MSNHPTREQAARLEAAGYVNAYERPRCGNCAKHVRTRHSGDHCLKHGARVSVMGWCADFERKPEHAIKVTLL